MKLLIKKAYLIKVVEKPTHSDSHRKLIVVQTPFTLTPHAIKWNPSSSSLARLKPLYRRSRVQINYSFRLKAGSDI